MQSIINPRALSLMASLLLLFTIPLHGGELPDSAAASQSVVPAAEPEKPNEFTLSGGILVRGELRNGGLATDEDPSNTAAFIMERTRVAIGYKRRHLELSVTGQHSGVWGQTNNGSFNLFEAWAMYRATNGLFAKVGRQALAYDDERIIGTSDWTMTGSSHDVLLLGYDGKNDRVQTFFAFNQNANNLTGGTYYVGGSKSYKSMITAWYHHDFAKIPLSGSLLFMNVGTQFESNNAEERCVQYQQLAGIYLKSTPANWKFEGSFYYQFGHSEWKIPIRAWMMSFRGECQFGSHFKTWLGYEHLSGDEKFAVPPSGGFGLTEHKVIRGFSALYGSHHKFYGAMDFFYVSTYVGGFTPGLQIATLGGKWFPKPSMSLNALYQFVATSAALNGHNRPLGHNMEVSFSWNVLKDFNISLGYSHMIGTDTMEFLKRTDANRHLNWAWLSLNFTPRFLKVKW